MAVIITLLIAGVLLLLLEVFLPGGVIGIFGLLILLVAVIMGFMHDVQVGLSLLLGLLILGPIALWAWIKYFPESKFGKLLMLDNDAGDWHGFDDDNAAWLHKTGVARTDLRPSGNATIDDQRIDVITEGEMIDKGTPIRVIAVEGNRIIVAEYKEPEST